MATETTNVISFDEVKEKKDGIKYIETMYTYYDGLQLHEDVDDAVLEAED